MASFSYIFQTVYSIARSPCPRHMKTGVLWSYLKCALKLKVLPKSQLGAGIERMAGASVSHLSLPTLCGLFEEVFAGLEYFFPCEKTEPVIIDCGSNIGMSVLFFKKLYPAARVTAFEPDAETFSQLEANIERNGLGAVVAYKKAVAGEEGTIPFYFDPGDKGSLLMSTNKDRISGASQEVEAVLLSSYVTEPIDFLKLDVEGAELAVMHDLQETGKLQFIDQMVIEYHHHIQPEHDGLSKMLTLLEENGFGYQLSGKTKRPFARKVFQDILVYGYRK